MKKFEVGRAFVRKLMTTLGLLLPGIAMALAGHVGCQPVLLVVLFTISVGFDGFTTPGFKRNAKMIQISIAIGWNDMNTSYRFFSSRS